MPLLHISTNVSIEDPDTVSRALSSHMAIALGKPEAYVMIALEHVPHMLFAGTSSACAYAEFKSIGLPQEQTQALSESTCTQLERHLQIPPDRIYIEFADAERHMWGFNSKTFAR